MKETQLENIQLIALIDELNQLLQKEMTIKLRWELTKIQKAIEPTLKMVDENKNELIKKYGTVDSDGNISVKPNTPEYQSFMEDWFNVLQIKTTIQFEQITQKDELFTLKVLVHVLFELL
jgi:hypothetical protein